MAIRLTLDDIAALDHHVAVTIDWRGRRIVQRLDRFAARAIDLAPVTPFGR